MENKGYYKDPETKDLNQGSFEDAWKKFMNNKVKGGEVNNPKNTFIQEIIKTTIQNKNIKCESCHK